MLHSKLIPGDFGKVFMFPNGVDPGRKYLRCGRTYPKHNFIPQIYNLFPFDTSQLVRTTNPYMTSNTAPSPFVIACSSAASFGGNGSMPAINAFNAAWTQGPYNGSSWGSYYTPSNMSSPQWIELNLGTGKNLFLVEFIFHFQRAEHLTKWNIQVFNDTTGTNSVLYDKCDVPAISVDWHPIDIPVGYILDKNLTGNRFRVNLLAGAILQHYPMIDMIRFTTVTLEDYLLKTTHFIVPDPAEKDPNYTAWLYIGPNNPIDNY